MMHASVIVVLSTLLYCAINGLMMMVFSRFHYGISRLHVFFNRAFITAGIAWLIIVGFEYLFLVYYCRIRTVAERFFSVATDRCPSINKNAMLVHDSFAIGMITALIAMTIQFFLYRDQDQIDETWLMTYLLLSNACAAIIKYGFITLIY